ncbi:spore gernimation protein GerQ [Bacillus sp. SA1-12]|uniref:spore coat protein n=1 Tax=Bacillus sp. SA1-12 TaxID=1455638 RepID=UPI0006270E3C|nr:spore coat protein [Bacillus sp. SA1-12]KKI90124.1 spore gernimation protein GerQ [Bacillus sp. SA1-12]
MTNILQNLAGMGGMTEQVIASDFLISSKSAVRNIAFAITETSTPELRAALRDQLRAAVETHERISSYISSKGYYHPYDLVDQINVRLQDAQAALDLQKQ